MKHRKRLHNIVATVSYADIFEYPLTQEELFRWAIGTFSIRCLPRGIRRVGDYIVFSGREHIIRMRRIRMRVAKTKWERMRRLTWVFRLFPTVLLVGVTGGLAMNNAKRDDDIDLFFVTQRYTLWVTRMLITLLTDVFRLRRRPNESRVRDKICLNMFVSEEALALPKTEQDLFSAHEVLQMIPIFEKEGTYGKFLNANRWVKEYLPNAWKEQIASTKFQIQNKSQAPSSKFKTVLHLMLRYCLRFVIWNLRFLETPSRALQLWYMRKRRTNEVLRSGMIRFHPRDARVWVREKFGLHLRCWNIPLDKIFYHR